MVTRKKKLEKTSTAPLPPSTTAKFYCFRCGNAFSRQRSYFPASHAPMYRRMGYLPWCNDCIEDMYDQYRAEMGDKEALRRMCMLLDLYWDEAIYDMVDRTSGVQSRIRTYIGKTNIVRYIDKTFDDTLRMEAAKNAEAVQPPVQTTNVSDEETEQEPPVEVDQSIIDFWGKGYEPEFYDELQRRYAEWTGDADVADPAKRSIYRQICLLEATIARDAAKGVAIDKNVNTLNNLIGSMNMKPAQQKDDVDTSLEKMPLGVGIQKWEYSRPLPETPKRQRDIHGIIKNITTWYLGHASKMVGLRNSYCKMYEDEMAKLRVKRPEYDEEDDDTLLTDLFGDGGNDEGGGPK